MMLSRASLGIGRVGSLRGTPTQVTCADILYGSGLLPQGGGTIRQRVEQCWSGNNLLIGAECSAEDNQRGDYSCYNLIPMPPDQASWIMDPNNRGSGERTKTVTVIPTGNVAALNLSPQQAQLTQRALLEQQKAPSIAPPPPTTTYPTTTQPTYREVAMQSPATKMPETDPAGSGLVPAALVSGGAPPSQVYAPAISPSTAAASSAAASPTILYQPVPQPETDEAESGIFSTTNLLIAAAVVGGLFLFGRGR